MRKIKYSIFLFLLGVNSLIATNIVGYEYWFNNTIDSKVGVSVSPTEQLSVDELIATDGLPAGVHAINFRFLDDSARWSSVDASLFIKRLNLPATGTNKIEKGYWWFDSDFANKQEMSFTPNTVLIIDELIATSTLPNGIHSINCTFIDSRGIYAPVSSFLFIKRALNPSAGSNTITKCQYWIDNNIANTSEISLSAGEIVAVNDLINTSALPTGIHSINFRFQDANGVWSSITSSLFKRMSLRAYGSTPNIVACEYWFDNGFDTRQQIPISADTVVNVDELINVQLPVGVHSLNVRFQDANGVWSSVSMSLIRKFAVISTNPNYITAYRYWVDDEVSSANMIILPAPVNPMDLTTEIDMSAYSVDEHLFHMQFRDTRGAWSSVTTDSVSRESYLSSQFSVANTPACDTVKVSFTNLSKDADSLIWSFGDGTYSYDTNPTHVYTTSGNYSVQLIARDTILHIDSTLTVNVPVTVYSSPVINLGSDKTICDYDSVQLMVNDEYQTYMWNGISGDSSIYSKGGTHILEVTDINGCKALDTVIVELFVRPTTPVIVKEGDSLTTNPITEGTLQWYKDNSAINDADSTVYKPIETASYHVAVNSNDGCYTINSNIINVVISAIMETGIANITLYPNPTVDKLYFSHNLYGAYSLHVYDVEGQRLINFRQNTQSGSIDVSDLNKGVYVLVFEQNGQVKHMQRFIKK